MVAMARLTCDFLATAVLLIGLAGASAVAAQAPMVELRPTPTPVDPAKVRTLVMLLGSVDETKDDLAWQGERNLTNWILQHPRFIAEYDRSPNVLAAGVDAGRPLIVAAIEQHYPLLLARLDAFIASRLTASEIDTAIAYQSSPYGLRADAELKKIYARIKRERAKRPFMTDSEVKALSDKEYARRNVRVGPTERAAVFGFRSTSAYRKLGDFEALTAQETDNWLRGEPMFGAYLAMLLPVAEAMAAQSALEPTRAGLNAK